MDVFLLLLLLQTLDEQEIFTDEEMETFAKAYEERQRQKEFGGHAQPGEVNVSYTEDMA